MRRALHPFHIMAKPHGPVCNLDCTYCYYLEKEKLYGGPAASLRMSDELLEEYIRQSIAAQPGEVVSFAWQGGEPTLLGVNFFEKVLALQRRYADGRSIENALQTNGTLLDDGWGEFLARNGFLVGLSIDGPRALHDLYRVGRDGQSSFDRVMRGLGVLQRHGVAFNTLTTVHRGNADHPREVYGFLKEIGSRYLQLIPIVEQRAAEPDPSGLVLLQPAAGRAAEVTEWSVEPLQFGRFLAEIFDLWVREDVGRVFVQHFDVALESWLGLPQSLCIFAPTCGQSLALEHDGTLYSCDHFVYPENALGNLREQSLAAMVEDQRQQAFGEAKRTTLPGECLRCEVCFACHGECPKHRFMRDAEGVYGLNYLCAGYKHFFRHIDPAMRFMAGELRQGRAPANVMDWIRAAEQG